MLDHTRLPQLIIGLGPTSAAFCKKNSCEWDTAKIFPHTTKHGTNGRFITLPIQRSAVHNQLAID